MSEDQITPPPPPPPPPPPSDHTDAPPSPPQPSPFDPSRMIGVIKRKALINELAAMYHAECLAYCQDLLELQSNWEEEQQADTKTLEDMRKVMQPCKRLKKSR